MSSSMQKYMLSFLFLASLIGCKSNRVDSEIRDISADRDEASEEEFDQLEDSGVNDANPFKDLDTVPGKMVMSGTFMQEYDDDFYNIGFSIFQSDKTAYFVHKILNQIVIEIESGISKPQAVDNNDPEAIPMKIVKEGDVTVYKSVLNAWPDTYVRVSPAGRIINVSLLKSVTRLVQDPKIDMKDFTYPGQKARIMVDTDI